MNDIRLRSIMFLIPLLIKFYKVARNSHTSILFLQCNYKLHTYMIIIHDLSSMLNHT